MEELWGSWSVRHRDSFTVLNFRLRSSNLAFGPTLTYRASRAAEARRWFWELGMEGLRPPVGSTLRFLHPNPIRTVTHRLRVPEYSVLPSEVEEGL